MENWRFFQVDVHGTGQDVLRLFRREDTSQVDFFRFIVGAADSVYYALQRTALDFLCDRQMLFRASKWTNTWEVFLALNVSGNWEELLDKVGVHSTKLVSSGPQASGALKIDKIEPSDIVIEVVCKTSQLSS